MKSYLLILVLSSLLLISGCGDSDHKTPPVGLNPEPSPSELPAREIPDGKYVAMNSRVVFEQLVFNGHEMTARRLINQARCSNYYRFHSEFNSGRVKFTNTGMACLVDSCPGCIDSGPMAGLNLESSEFKWDGKYLTVMGSQYTRQE